MCDTDSEPKRRADARIAARAEGRRTALVEMERGNLFTLSLGNVQPDDVLVIRFAYFEELDAWKDELALQIPFSPGVRYIPGEPLLRSNSGKGATDDTDQVPDASRISPPRIDEMHPDAARLSLSGKLDGRNVDLSSISSPTHATAVRPTDKSFEIFLPANASAPDRDFVLRWRRAARPGLLSAAWISADQEATYALAQLGARDEVPESREGNDIYFLVDRFGSMAGEKWAKTAEALIAFAHAAAQNDRVWITFFESSYRDFAKKPLERDALLRDPNFQSIARLGTHGGTELLPALRHVLAIEQQFSIRRRSHIVLITDGQIGNEAAVLKAISGRALPVHCFGIDDAVNESFLRQLAGQQRGTSVFLTPNDDLVRPVAILGSRLCRPALTELVLDGDWELADTELPDIHAGQVVFASIRVASKSASINVAGKDAAGRPVTLGLEAQAVETDLPKLTWMKRRIDSLLQGGKDKDAIALAEKANLVCRGAAFIAWDDAEKVPIAQEEVYQPSLSHDSKLMVLLSRPRVLERPLGGNPSLYHLRDIAESLEEGSDEELVGDVLFNLRKTERLTEQLTITIDSVFYAPDGAELVGIVWDWATHTDEDQVCQTLCVLLRGCERDRDARRLRRVLSDFFLALPDPWKTRASSILAAQTLDFCPSKLTNEMGNHIDQEGE
jgi:Ca-activated chloride channel family protein